MSSQRHTRISELFLAACEKPPHERTAFLERECADDVELRRAVEQLLKHDAASAAVDTPVVGDATQRAVLSEALPDAPLPARIGRYEILERLGEGGMGVVYKARQPSPQRVVALKVIRQPYLSQKSIRRFEVEAEALARLQHPGIAQIFEAGTAEGEHGPQPYFAMELIEGLPVTEHARRTGLNLRQHAELIADICDAVHHAHQNGVIHRDLKPANILIDESGQPKILDFGVARATDREAQTADGQVI